MPYISPTALTTVSCGVGSCRAMPAQGSMEPQVQMAITAAPVELGERGIKMSSEMEVRAVVAAAGQAFQVLAAMAETVKEGIQRAVSAMMRTEVLADQQAREEGAPGELAGTQT
jgi:hypothetical protein